MKDPMTGEPASCQCPPSWQGTVPPICPVHNPMTFTATTGNAFMNTYTLPATAWVPAPLRLHVDDIERIAQRVVELMKKDARPKGAL